MNWDQIEGKWKQMKGSVKAKWGQLTDSDFERINGKREELVGLIQERYGIQREAAEEEVRKWAESLPAARQEPAQQETTMPPRRKAG